VKILWIKSDFLHPTNRGGQIRTLEMLRRLHCRHEVHFVGFDDPAQPEGPEKSSQYCSRAYPVRHVPPSKESAAFYWQLAGNLFSPLPVVISRQKSQEMTRLVSDLISQHKFDAVVSDFLSPSINIPDLARSVLFQHNVETMIWRRRAEHASNAVQKGYLGLQARRMFNYEKLTCRAVRRVIAVSRADAESMERMFGLEGVPHVSTGVDVEGMTPPAGPAATAAFSADLVFTGSMDWMPNIDAAQRFAAEILPIIRRQKPDCSLAIVGRMPPRSLQQLAERDPRITVTGTVPDVRPFLWGSQVSIVPLRIGGGTRLKIYEAMAARVPVISTTIGAEGLEIHPPHDIRIADSPEDFAAQCLELLADRSARERMRARAYELVATRFSWKHVIDDFERLLA
jgi:glycosyltransferase involved in cell wall biosynthesis